MQVGCIDAVVVGHRQRAQPGAHQRLGHRAAQAAGADEKDAVRGRT